MIGRSFNHGWRIRRRLGVFERLGAGDQGYLDVTLPHDAMLGRGRDPDGETATIAVTTTMENDTARRSAIRPKDFL